MSTATREIVIAPLGLGGTLQLCERPRGLVLFAHGSGSSRFSPRNAAVAQALNVASYDTLLMDLLTPQEEGDRSRVFDIALLADRLLSAVHWIERQPDLAVLPLGLFGASTGAAAALQLAARLGGRVRALVSRGGRPDLAGPALHDVRAPTLLIVGGEDEPVLALNRDAYAALTAPKALRIVPGATHLFPEPGALEMVIADAIEWFDLHLGFDTLPDSGGH